jgi:AcrR family transcriptional regulator
VTSSSRSPERVATHTSGRTTYRHGDLRRALLEAGVELARGGGPDAVVLREATRRAGVVPNAAYRHFAGREDLLEAVRAAALSALAVAMETELAAAAHRRRSPKPSAAQVAQTARASLRAVGTAYVRFALAETGLFRTAFSAPTAVAGGRDAATAGGSGMNPFQLLGGALDLMVAAGVLPAIRRPGAEYLAWSAVHGLAMLLIDGPLKGADPKRVAGWEQRVLDMVENGL